MKARNFRSEARNQWLAWERGHIWTYGHTDIRTYRHTDIRTYGHMDIWTYGLIDIQTYAHTETPLMFYHTSSPSGLLPKRDLSGPGTLGKKEKGEWEKLQHAFLRPEQSREGLRPLRRIQSPWKEVCEGRETNLYLEMIWEHCEWTCE